VRSVGDVGFHGDRLAATRLHFVDERVGGVGAAVVVDDDGRAGFRELEHDRASDITCTAGDDSDFVGQIWHALGLWKFMEPQRNTEDTQRTRRKPLLCAPLCVLCVPLWLALTAHPAQSICLSG